MLAAAARVTAYAAEGGTDQSNQGINQFLELKDYEGRPEPICIRTVNPVRI